MIRARHSPVPFVAAIFSLLAAAASPVAAKVIPVGPTRTFKLPHQAAAVAVTGDIVRIDPGVYADCAVWRTSGLVIEAAGPGVVLSGKTCLGQGIFVVFGNAVTVQGITFAEATVPGRNGAGIKMLGDDLTVRNSRFLHNENGILTGGSADSTVRVLDSEFIGNGACVFACAHALYAGAPIQLLDVERCVFLDTRTTHHIKSRALSTIVRDSRIEDGATGTSSYLIETPQGGDLLVERNVLEKGPNSSNPATAIAIGLEGVRNPTASLQVRDNQFRDDSATPTVFVRNESGVAAQVSGNMVSGPVTMLEGPGVVVPKPNAPR
jgi:hypothetical protein